MLRKETREFLEYWPQENSRDPKIQKIRKKYVKRNPSQMYNRAVKYANKEFEDLALLLSKLPSNYKDKVNLDSGIYLLEDATIQSHDPDLKLKVALQKVNAGVDNLKDILLEDSDLNKLFMSKFQEIKTICNHIYNSKTGKTLKKLKRNKLESDSKSSKDKFHGI